MRPWKSRVWLCVLSGLVCGCGSQPLVQVETAVQGDGSCDRTIWQPTSELLPAEGGSAEWKSRWERFGPSPVPPAFAAEQPRDNSRAYFTASGHFPTVADIPNHYHCEVGKEPFRIEGRLVREYERRDHAFVVEHRWNETVTDTVTREGFLKSRDAFLARGLPLLQQATTKIYGDRYDVRGLLRDIGENGRRFLEQAALLWFEESCRHGTEKEQTLALAKLAREFGLDLLNEAGELVDQKEGERRWRSFLRHPFVLGFRQRDGSRLSEAEIQAILLAWAPGAPPSAEWTQFWHEKQPEIEALLTGPFMGMVGLYHNPLGMTGSGNPKFAFRLHLPGAIVESNGTPSELGRTAWSFSGDRAFPDGFVMQARSLEIDRSLQEAVLGRVPIQRLDQALALVRQVEGSPLVRERLGKVRTTRQTKWLQPDGIADERDRERLAEIRRLLEMPK